MQITICYVDDSLAFFSLKKKIQKISAAVLISIFRIKKVFHFREYCERSPDGRSVWSFLTRDLVLLQEPCLSMKISENKAKIQ